MRMPAGERHTLLAGGCRLRVRVRKDGTMELRPLLVEMLRREGSDLHIRSGTPPRCRSHGRLLNLVPEPVSDAEIVGVLKSMLSPAELKALVEKADLDVMFVCAEAGRFRTNIFRTLGSYGLVMRHIPTRIPSLDGLGLPPVLKTLAGAERGIVLVTGTTGSGKSTTLAAMIDHINTTEECNVITVEDPVEFVHTSKKSLISHRSLGSDVPSFQAALKYALRQDPDVILIGEMRDLETMMAAVEAAETGHLVFSTLHTSNCSQTVERILNAYPANLHDQVRLQLSLNLAGVISQRLIPTKDGKGRVAALEIMVSTPSVRKHLLEGSIAALYKDIEDGGTEGMQSFNQVLAALFTEGRISLESALTAASRPDELKLKLKMEGLI
ncbi:MAG: PilT/PilU family type 4a pilus ATPase [Candidatus Riflebacteria bacterium]|nr:PilT/PilU family type 4a pilus ATPase [Candidatus Riflebacteria bacterium]